MSDYTQVVDFRIKDDLATNDPNKVIQGSEFDTEFNAVATAIATKTETLPVIPEYEYETREGNSDPLAAVDVESDFTIVSTTFTPLDATNQVLVEAYYGLSVTMTTAETSPSDFRLPINCVVTNNETNNSFGYGDLIERRTGRSHAGTDVFNSTGDRRKNTYALMFLDTDNLVTIAGASNAGYTFEIRSATISGGWNVFNSNDHFEWEASIVVKELL